LKIFGGWPPHGNREDWEKPARHVARPAGRITKQDDSPGQVGAAVKLSGDSMGERQCPPATDTGLVRNFRARILVREF
jgi:hypothetical protein